MATTSVIGDGGWGTALALILHQNGHRVRLWGPFADYVEEMRGTRDNRKFLPGVPLPADLELESDRVIAVSDAEAVVLAVPSRYYRPVLESFARILPPAALLVSVTKGIDRETGGTMSEVAAGILGRGPVAALSGPSLAAEAARGIPTAVTIACRDHEIAKNLQDLFNSRSFRVYSSDDVAGVEIGGALKNVIAIAAGVCDGIGFGDNAKAALITRGLAEITRLGGAIGARPATFAGLSGMGDLVVTCFSRLSRNRSVGERLGRGESITEILGHMDQCAEGVWTCTAARDLARKHGIDVPITDEVHAVVHEGKNPREAVQSLLSREPKPERG